MPKVVDSEERRRRIAAAVWTLASERGLEQGSLREVAETAGMSLGQLQHYFRSKDDLLAFALELVAELATKRIQARLQSHAVPPGPMTIVREVLYEMLPLDAESRAGILVSVAYFSRAIHDERLRRIAGKGIPELRDILAAQLRAAIAQDELRPDIDAEAEAMILISLVEGLRSYVFLEILTPEGSKELLESHLRSLDRT